MLDQHPVYPWIAAGPTPQGFVAQCDACRVAFVMDPSDAPAFAAEHSDHKKKGAGVGFGDVVHSLAGFFGFNKKPCTPCEQQRVKMNGWW